MSRFLFRSALTFFSLAIGVFFLGGDRPGIAGAAEPASNVAAIQRAMRVHGEHGPRMRRLNGVVGTATGMDSRGNWALKVYTRQGGAAGIPQEIDNVPVQVEVVGRIVAMQPPAGNGRGGRQGPGGRHGGPVPPGWPGGDHRRPGGPGSGPGRPGDPGGPGGGHGGNPGDPGDGGDSQIDPTAFFSRPSPIGVSTGNANDASAGTIACRVKDEFGSVYALSNNHVYALENSAAIGDTIVQPGMYDILAHGYDPADTTYNLGALAAFVSIDFTAGASNTVDAALALCAIGTLGTATPSDGYGTPKSEIGAAVVGQTVQKYGRTSSLTTGTVSGIDATVTVTYDSGDVTFVSQIVVTAGQGFIQSGDSGSLLVASDRTPVGLLFAGNDAGTYAIANDIGNVLNELGTSTGLTLTIDGE